MARVRFHGAFNRLDRRGTKTVSKKVEMVTIVCYIQDLIQALLVHGHLDRDVREVVVERLVRRGRDARVVLGVLVELCDWADNEGDIGDDL